MFKQVVISTSKSTTSAQYIAMLLVVLLLSGCTSLKENYVGQSNEVERFNNKKKTLPVKNTSRKISWVDHADNENGYVVERKGKGDYLSVAILAVDSNFYEDSDPILKGVHCYRIGAYNQAGTTYSEDFCMDILTDSKPVLVANSKIPRSAKTLSVSKSGIPVAGRLLNNTRVELLEPSGDASLIEVDQGSGSSIDVSEAEYVTSNGIAVNENYNDGMITGIAYSGNAKFRDGGYEFIDNGSVVASGYMGMSWNEKNSVALSLNSSLGGVASLYFKAGAWTSDLSELELIINGESSLIELGKGYTWFHIRADIEFQGALTVELKPVGEVGGYSRLFFAGLTLSE